MHLVGRSGVLAVVVRVRHELDGAAVVAVDGVVHPRAGTDRLRLQIILGQRGGEHLDHAQTALQQAVEGVLQREGDGLVVLRRHRVDEFEEGAVGGVGHVLLERVHHVGGGDVRAVGELGTVAQGNLVLGVGDLRGLAGGKRVIGLVGVQIEVVQALEHMPRGGQHQRGAVADRVDVRARVGHGAGQRAALGRCAGVGAGIGRRGVRRFAAATAAGQSQACCSRRDGAARQERAARQSCFQRLFHWFPSISVSGQEAPNVRACLRTRTTAVPIIRENPQKIKNL